MLEIEFQIFMKKKKKLKKYVILVFLPTELNWKFCKFRT